MPVAAAKGYYVLLNMAHTNFNLHTLWQFLKNVEARNKMPVTGIAFVKSKEPTMFTAEGEISIKLPDFCGCCLIWLLLARMWKYQVQRGGHRLSVYCVLSVGIMCTVCRYFVHSLSVYCVLSVGILCTVCRYFVHSLSEYCVLSVGILCTVCRYFVHSLSV